MNEHLLKAVDDRIDDLVALTVELIRFPTVNPPGEAYTPCAEYLGARLKKRGFGVEFVRGEGAPGDTDRYPRTNVIARFDGRGPGADRAFQLAYRRGRGRRRLDASIPFAGIVRDGRVYGRGACDMKGGLAASIIAAEAFMAVYPDFPGAIEISGTADEESGGFGGVAHLAQARLLLEAARRPRHHPRAAQQGPHLPWPSRRLVGGDRDQGRDRARLDAVPRRLRGPPHGRGAATPSRTSLFPALDRKQTRMPVVPEGARRSTMNINSIHGGQTDDFRPGLPSPNVPDSCRLTIDRRFLLEEDLAEVKGEVDRDPRAAEARAPEIRLRDPRRHGGAAADDRARRAGGRGGRRRASAKCSASEPDYVISPGTYDQKHVARIGHLHDCIAYGPGILDLAHRPDEWVGIADMVESAKVMAIGLDVLLRGGRH